MLGNLYKVCLDLFFFWLDGLPADGQAQAQTAIATAFGAVLRKEAVQDTERIELSILSNMTVGNRRF